MRFQGEASLQDCQMLPYEEIQRDGELSSFSRITLSSYDIGPPLLQDSVGGPTGRKNMYTGLGCTKFVLLVFVSA